MDFGTMFRTHEKNGADITIATIPVTEKEATEFGILKSDEEHKITSFIEKPAMTNLPDWISDTGDVMHKLGQKLSRLNGYLSF